MRTEWIRLKTLHPEKTFIQIPKWLIAMKLPISGDALLLLAYMADHNDSYHPGIKQISDETGYDQRKIKRLFNELVNVGMVCRTPGGSDGKFKTFETNIHNWFFLSQHIYGPFPSCSHCGYSPGHLCSPKSVTTKLSGSTKSVTTKLSGSTKSVTTSSVKSCTTNQTRPDNKLTRQYKGAKAPPPPPPSKPKKTNFQLDAQTPQDLEEKPAKKKPNQKSSRQPPFSPVVDGNDYSGILALIYELEPLGWKINRQKLLDFLSHETWSHYSLEEKHLIVTHYRDTWIDKSDDDIKALKKRKKPSSPSQAGLRPYLKNPKYGLKDELERLKLSNSQGSNLYGDELFPLLKSNPNDLSKQSKIE